MSEDPSGESGGGASVPVMVGLIAAVFILAIITMFYAARSGAAHSRPAADAPAAVR